MLDRIKSTACFIRNKIAFEPEVGIILGTGLGGLADGIDTVASLDYHEIPDFPVSTVEGHRGRLIFGMLGGKKVVAMQGRFHYYEGYTPQQVVFPVRVMKLLGIKNLLVSAFNAYDYQIATRHFHHMHGFCLQIGTGITKPAQLFIQARSNQQFTKALYTLLICCKSVILNNDFFYFRHFLCNIPKLFNNVFFRTHTRQVSMHRLRINTKIAMIGTPSTSKYLDFGISRCRKKVLAYI